MYTLIAFLSSQTISTAGKAPDDFRESFMEACIGGEAGPSGSVEAHADATLPEAVIRICADALPLTPGAAQLLRQVNGLFPALRIILQDKAFREAFRAYAQERGKGSATKVVLAGAASLGVPQAAKAPPREAPKPAPAIVAKAEFASPPRGRPDRDPPPASVARFAHLPVDPSGRTADAAMLIGELAAALSDPGVPLNRLKSAMRSLAGSSNRIALVLLQRAAARGEIQLRGDVLPYLFGETARALVGLNANASAYAISAALLERYEPEGSDALPMEDLLRLLHLHARVCVRTGRIAEGERLFRRLHLTSPAASGFALEYFFTMSASKPAEAAHLARGFLGGGVELDYHACLALAEFFLSQEGWTEVNSFLMRAARLANGRHEHLLTAANMALRTGDQTLWCQLLHEFGRRSKVPLGRHDPSVANRVFSFEGAGAAPEPCPEPISVIMTAFNSAATIEAAIASVLAQRGVTLELIVLDDGSTDGSRERLAALAAADPRLRPVMNARNMGTYASKNHGITISRYPLLAFHDSDDWMHPLHLYRQAEKLLAGHVCTTSQWLRMRADGQVIRRGAGGYAHLNPASTLFHRSVPEELGPFDFVRAGADAEYLTRIRFRYGWSSVLQMEDCLALGLHHESSLTQSGATAFDEHRYSAVRLAYTEAWMSHHLGQIERDGPFTLRTEHERPFEVPPEIRC